MEARDLADSASTPIEREFDPNDISQLFLFGPFWVLCSRAVNRRGCIRAANCGARASRGRAGRHRTRKAGHFDAEPARHLSRWWAADVSHRALLGSHDGLRAGTAGGLAPRPRNTQALRQEVPGTAERR